MTSRSAGSHRFDPEGEGTRLTDEIEMEAPAGPLGWIAERTFIRLQFNRMFAFRHARTKALVEKGA